MWFIRRGEIWPTRVRANHGDKHTGRIVLGCSSIAAEVRVGNVHVADQYEQLAVWNIHQQLIVLASALTA